MSPERRVENRLERHRPTSVIVEDVITPGDRHNRDPPHFRCEVMRETIVFGAEWEGTAGVVSDQVDPRVCKTCGTTFRYAGHGSFCRPACRRLASELLRAEQAFQLPDKPQTPSIRDAAGRVVIASDQDRKISSTLTEPEDWITLLHQLAAQLADPATTVARESHRLRRVLAQVMDGLDIAHLGGSNQPQ